MKYLFGKIMKVSAISVILCAILCRLTFAADGDRFAELYFSNDPDEYPKLIGTAFFRAGALWVPAELLRAMNVPLQADKEGKSFSLEVKDPAQAFNCPALSRLAGKSISLTFPALAEDGVEYFNMSGMQNITKLNFISGENSVIFTKNNSSVCYEKSSAPSRPTASGKLTLVWEHVAKENPNLGAEETIRGLDVISPTWFNLTDAAGGMANRASFAYAESARRRGYSIWGLVSNGFNAANTTAFLADEHAMKIFAARMLIYAKLYGLDGINIDFEGMNENDSDRFVSFAAKISKLLHDEGLTLSVDVFIPANTKSSRSHNRAALAKYADYIMLMAYDEHWRTSPRAGSVASLPWVAKAVEGTLAEGVPAKKLVLGVPFYMRRWEETKKGKDVKVKSYTLTMQEAEDLSAEKHALMKWLEDQGQNYFSYTADGKANKVWVEDADSIAAKLSLVNKHGLAGMAAWRKGHEKPEVWNVIAKLMGK